MIPAQRSTDPALQYVPQPAIEPPGSQSDMSTFAKAHNIEGAFDPKQYDTVAISRYLRIKFREYEAKGDQDKNLHELLVSDFGHWEVDNFNKADVRSISIVRQFCITRGIWIGTPRGPSNTRGKTVWRAINSDYYPNWTMEQIIKVQDDYKSISRGIHIRKSNLLGTIRTTPYDDPSAVQIRTPSERSLEQKSPVNQPQMSQPHMAQTLNPNLYQPVPPPEVIVNEPSAGPEFVTPLMHRKEKQPSTQEAHGYYEVPTVKDEPVNLENFDNPRYKYREEEDYVPRQRFTRRGQEERLPHQSTQPRPWSRVPLQPTVPEYQSSYRQSVPPPVPHQSSVPVPRPPDAPSVPPPVLYQISVPVLRPPDAPVPQPHYPSFTAPLSQRNPTPYVSNNTNDSHLPPVDYSRQLANLGKAYQKEEEGIREARLMSKDREHLSVGKPIKFNGGIVQMTTEGILTLKQERQVAAIAIVKGTQGVTTSTRGIIRTGLTPKKQYVAQRARGAYVASICQPEAAYDLSHAAQMTDPTPDDITALNKRLQWQLDNPSRGLTFARLDLTSLKIVVFTDSSFANNQDLSSQIGYVICLADASDTANIIYWSSIKCKRVTRSVLAGELYGMAHGFDLGAVLKATISKMLQRNIPLILCTDSKSLYDCLVWLGTTFEKRLMIDVMSLRLSYERREVTEIKWIHGNNNPANSMTKSKSSTALRDLVNTNRIILDTSEWVERTEKKRD